MTNARRFVGKDCVVTGAGGGIGRAVALRLAAEGARVAILDINLDGARETLLLCGDDHHGFAGRLDVRSEASIANAAAQAAEVFGGVDVLVNNAGIEKLGSIEETTPDVWDDIMAVNLRGPYLTSRIFAPQLLARAAATGGAAVVHNASLMGQVSSPRLAAY